MIAARWAEELADSGAAVHAMHPGWADTPGVKSSLISATNAGNSAANSGRCSDAPTKPKSFSPIR